MYGPDMETERLLYDDGRSGPRRRTDRKTQRGRPVSVLASTGLDVQSHMRQRGREPAAVWSASPLAQQQD